MTNMSSSPVVMFIAFVIFIFCQYAIWVTSNLMSHWFGLTGRVYWCVVLVAFLILNQLCFGAYDFVVGEKDDWNDEWDGD